MANIFYVSRPKGLDVQLWHPYRQGGLVSRETSSVVQKVTTYLPLVDPAVRGRTPLTLQRIYHRMGR